MKTSKIYFAFGVALVIAAVSLAYSLQTAARVRDLERRLQRTEAALQSQITAAERIRDLEARVQQDELSATQPRFIEINHTSGFEPQINQRPEPPRLTPRHWEPSDLEQLEASAPSDSVATR